MRPLVPIFLLGTACLAETESALPDPPAPVVDAGLPPGPEPDRVGEPMEAVPLALTSNSVRFAQALLDGVLVEADGQLAWARTGTVTVLGNVDGPVLGATDFDVGVVVSTASRFYLLRQQRLEPSPLGNALLGAPGPLLARVTAEGPEMWIAGEGGLFVYRRGEVVSVQPNNLPTARALLVEGARMGSAALWVASGDVLYALVGSQAFPERKDYDVRDIASDAVGTLWIVDGAGRLRSRNQDGTGRLHDAVTDVVAVQARRDRQDVWFETRSALWRFEAGEFRRVDGVSGTLLGLAPEGSALVATATGLMRVFGELRVEFLGLNAGQRITETTQIEVRPLLTERVQSLIIELDGAPVSVAGPPWRVTLDPELLESGVHLLEATATYLDGRTATGQLRFSYFRGPPPTWTNDILPLFTEKCTPHHANGEARHLDTSDRWIAEFDRILLNVRNGTMPLPPQTSLTPEQIGLIEAWQAAGFPLARD